ncbi:membrane dipeptidase-domain-containing protein [Annulohypoxylon maeteangense]|uniref:membrane dipeptidase-domain-containing protein n=1 Tax=Annulohypoxylon maeteangense TaxID=1927788 RepID=UPI002007335E|nr:membrane dipeptidase-domain-containing protein [Annulohypoxylon maeteangense]KAI0886559.1 membrane dipeptidase-domain-containing protein [Annulohypoxylon maeteangense]
MAEQASSEGASLPGDEQDTPDQSQSSAAPERSLVVHNQAQNSGFISRFRNHLFVAGFAFLLSPFAFLWPSESPVDPTNYEERTRRVLKSTPLIDGHNDLPWQLRIELHNRLYSGELDLTKKLLGHTDIQRMRAGMMGGQFWSVYTECDARQQDFEDPSWAVRETLEQIDVTRRFINEHPDHLQYCDTAACARKAFRSGRIASMIGIEGSHQIGGSIASLRQMYNLGARYLTLTHNCDTSFGTSAFTVVTSGGTDGGLFKLGYEAIKEMNRLGIMVDLAHVSHQTMRDVLSVARAPVIFSHSGAYGVTPHLRNVPDDVLRTVKRNGGIVMAVFVNRFLNMVDPGQATIHDVVDHVFHIAEVCGWDCVGVGSDFSGTRWTPIGLEDVSKFPDLVRLLMERGASDDQIRLFAGENILRVWSNIEKAAREIQATGEKPVEEEYDKRVWNKGLRDSPWMLRGSREKAIVAGTADKPHSYETVEGKHGPVMKGVY